MCLENDKAAKKTWKLFSIKFGSLKISITFAAAFRGKDLVKKLESNNWLKNSYKKKSGFIK